MACRDRGGNPGLRPYFLHLVRDPRGVASSLKKRVRYEAGVAGTMDSHGLTRSSLTWLYRGSLIEAEWGRSSHCMTMRYEDFVADPALRVAQDPAMDRHRRRGASLPR